jgi:hypothetical protein
VDGGRLGRWGAGNGRSLARRVALHGHDHAALAAVASQGGALRLVRGPVARRRGGRRLLRAAAGPLGTSLPRRLDLDHVRPAQIGPCRVELAGHRVTDRLRQQLAGRDHGRERGRRQ